MISLLSQKLSGPWHDKIKAGRSGGHGGGW